jgi:hypothetical protein
MPTTLNPLERINRIKERLAAATPGPWVPIQCFDQEDERTVVTGVMSYAARDRDGNTDPYLVVGHDENYETALIEEADYTLIAHAPGDLAHLILLCEKQEAMLHQLRVDYIGKLKELRNATVGALVPTATASHAEATQAKGQTNG